MRPNLLVAVLALAAASAFAQAPQQPFFNVVTLEASATADVPTDTLTVTLFVEEQGPDPGQLATRVNARLDEALAKARKEPKVEAHSGNYQTNPIYDRANQITGWRIRADIVLESRDFKAVGGAGRRAAAGAQAVVDDVFAVARRARGGRSGAADRGARQIPGEGARRRQGAGLPGLRARADRRAQRGSRAARPWPMRGVAMSAMADGAPPAPVPGRGRQERGDRQRVRLGGARARQVATRCAHVVPDPPRTHAPPTQRQDRRHARTGELHARDDRLAVPSRRRRVPPQFQPRHARRPSASGWRRSARSRRRRVGRSAC